MDFPCQGGWTSSSLSSLACVRCMTSNSVGKRNDRCSCVSSYLLRRRGLESPCRLFLLRITQLHPTTYFKVGAASLTPLSGQGFRRLARVLLSHPSKKHRCVVPCCVSLHGYPVRKEGVSIYIGRFQVSRVLKTTYLVLCFALNPQNTKPETATLH